MQEYIRISDPSKCRQKQVWVTPCFQEITKSWVDCDLCPVQLFREKNIERVLQMFHNGTCLMDERNPANMWPIAKYERTWERQKARPLWLCESMIKQET